MHYTMLLWPHANARYQKETLKLAQAELRLTLDAVAPGAAIGVDGSMPDLPCLSIETPEPLSPAALDAVRAHSLLYGLFESLPGGDLRPVAGRAPAYLGGDLPAILKYKGKTNEMFLQLLINVALYAGDFWPARDERLRLLDPMCGRGTDLFVAVNRGWHATGTDVDKNDLREAEKFFKRYLEYHRFKHNISHESRTVKGRPSADTARFDFADTPEHFKEKDTLSLRLSATDAAFGKNAFHIVACDLPYGVRHDAQPGQAVDRGANWLEALLRQALPAWRDALKPGGTVAVSFNAQSYPLEKLRHLMEEAGFDVLRGGAYDQFSHWVEQAITRDIAVCRKAH